MNKRNTSIFTLVVSMVSTGLVASAPAPEELTTVAPHFFSGVTTTTRNHHSRCDRSLILDTGVCRSISPVRSGRRRSLTPERGCLPAARVIDRDSDRVRIDRSAFLKSLTTLNIADLSAYLEKHKHESQGYINQCYSELRKASDYKMTPLQYAVSSTTYNFDTSLVAIRTLIAHGANIRHNGQKEQQEYPHSPLTLAKLIFAIKTTEEKEKSDFIQLFSGKIISESAARILTNSVVGKTIHMSENKIFLPDQLHSIIPLVTQSNKNIYQILLELSGIPDELKETLKKKANDIAVEKEEAALAEKLSTCRL